MDISFCYVPGNQFLSIKLIISKANQFLSIKLIILEKVNEMEPHSFKQGST